MRRITRYFLPILAALALAGCAIPGSQAPTQPPVTVNDVAATIVAATMQAATAQAQQAPLPSPLPPMPTSGGKPSLFINTDKAACRNGPGPDFKVIANFPAGTTVDLVGQDTNDNAWIVRDPGSNSLCWVSVMDGTPGGDFQSLPQMTPQPVSAAVPGKPSRGVWNFSCDNTTLTVILGWNPGTGTANGYRIYRKGTQIADVPASQTSYTEKIPFTYGGSVEYAVAAYNEAGLSQQLDWNIHCP